MPAGAERSPVRPQRGPGHRSGGRRRGAGGSGARAVRARRSRVCAPDASASRFCARRRSTPCALRRGSLAARSARPRDGRLRVVLPRDPRRSLGSCWGWCIVGEHEREDRRPASAVAVVLFSAAVCGAHVGWSHDRLGVLEHREICSTRSAGSPGLRDARATVGAAQALLASRPYDNDALQRVERYSLVKLAPLDGSTESLRLHVLDALGEQGRDHAAPDGSLSAAATSRRCSCCRTPSAGGTGAESADAGRHPPRAGARAPGERRRRAGATSAPRPARRRAEAGGSGRTRVELHDQRASGCRCIWPQRQ